MFKKMILVPSHELKKLTRPTEPTVRETAKDDLDEKMKAILEDPRLNSYEKIKRYESLLRRYLTLSKQDRDEESRVTFHLPPEEAQQQVQQQVHQQVHQQVQRPREEDDEMMEEVLKSLPPRDRKNARYIMQKLAEGGGGWTKRGEFVYKGDAVRGSHMIDLFKNLSLSFKSKNQTRPKGWNAFLTTLVETNIPSSSIHNRRARDQYARLKSVEEEEEGGQTPARRGRKPSRVKITLSPTWTSM